MFALFKDGNGRRDVRLPITYNGLTFNDPDAPANDDLRVERLIPATTIHTTQDRHQGDDGSEISIPTKVARSFGMECVLTAPNQAELFDKMRLVARSLDPVLVARDNPDERGFIALDGSIPTADTATYPSGLIDSRLYARALNPVQPAVIVGTGHAAQFTAQMICADPRAYLQSLSSATINSTSATVANSKADYPSYPTLTITASGSVDTEWSINRTDDSVNALRLALDLEAGDEVVVDMERRTIHLNDISAPQLYVGGGWFDLDPGDNAITVSSVTNLAVSLSWRPAFCL